VYGEELIPSGYSQVQETTELQRMRKTLLGSAGDPLYENIRLAQYMTLLQTHPTWSSFVSERDSRITYVAGAWTFYDVGSQVEVSGGSTMRLETTGKPITNNEAGQCIFRASISAEAGPALRIVDAISRQTRIVPIEVIDQVTTPFDIVPGVQGQILLSGPWAPGELWDASALATSVSSLSSVLTSLIDTAGVETIQLVAKAGEDVRDHWVRGYGIGDRLGAALVAYVLEMESLHGQAS
jgi:hypothetical protein